MTDRDRDDELPPPTDGQDWVDEILSRARSKAAGPTPEPRRSEAPQPADDAPTRPPEVETAEPATPPAPAVAPPPEPPDPVVAETPTPRTRPAPDRDVPMADDPPVRPSPRSSTAAPEPAPVDDPPSRAALRTREEIDGAAASDPPDPLAGGAEERRAAQQRRAAAASATMVADNHDDEVERWNEGDLLADDDEDPTSPSRSSSALRTAIEWTAVIVGALVVALLIKTFLFQAFYIPSQSMEPTLHKGDRVLVNKVSYDLHDVNRGDVIVFEKPPGMSGTVPDLIKRVIALPNETLELSGGEIYIDGQLLQEPYLPEGTVTNPKRVMSGCAGTPSDTTCIVPEGMILVMGDNRENSTDGRWFGPVSIDTIVGRAFIKVYPLGDIGFL